MIKKEYVYLSSGRNIYSTVHMTDTEKDLFGINRRKRQQEQAKTVGNQKLDEVMRDILANLQSMIPVVSQSATEEAMKIFYDTDASIRPSGEKLEQALDMTMERLHIVHPAFADMIERYDADQSGDRPVAYFVTMVLAAVSIESRSKRE